MFLSQMVYGSTTGRISGKVIDSSTGEPLIGANVMIKAIIKNGKEIPLSSMMGTATDYEGEYYIINVKPGTYVVECSYIGYKKTSQKGIAVFVDQTTTVNFTLEEELISGEEVVVIAKQPIVRRDLTSSSAKISGENMKNLPVESIQDVLALQAGVTTGANGGLHIRGGRSSEVGYYVDGLAVSNPFNNSLAVPVENNAIQEVEVISGTFNAEYGQAQSGIVNIVTKEGSEAISGSASAYFGDFVSSNDNIFLNIDDVNPTAQKFFEADISGPLLSKKLTFFLSGRITDLEGHLFGKHYYNPIDSSDFGALNPEDWYVESTGDSQFVAMNTRQNFSGTAKLAYQITPGIKLAYSFIANSQEYKNYSHVNRYNPFGLPTRFNKSFNHLVSLTHSLSSSVFYTLKFTMFETDYKSYVHEDPYNIIYIADYARNRRPSNIFSTGGINSGHSYQKSITYAAKAEISMMLGKYNFVKMGAEYRRHELDSKFFAVDVDPNVYGSYDRVIPPLTSTNHNQYFKEPTEISAYIQDKIEIEDLTVNVGVRFDYFDANSSIPTDFRDPANKLFPRSESEAFSKVSAKTQISPRLGLAFPITAKGVVHAAYGQFFQIPTLNRLYENPEFEVHNESFIGNADLEAQRTDMYEIGLQQELTDFLAVDVTAYYRNIRNLLGSKLYNTYRTDIVYGRYVNNSHGAVKGFSIAAKVRVPESGLVGDFNYTYQNAKGIASDPKQEFNDLTGLNEATSILIPLNWDLRHTFNISVSYAKESWGASIIGKFNSGYPFTPGGFVELRNQGRYNGEFNTDLNAYKRFKLGDFRLELFARIINLFDFYRVERLPQIRPEDEAIHTGNGFNAYNSLYEFNLNPLNQPVPREVRVGIRMFY